MSSPYRLDADVIRERRDAVARELTETESALERLTAERGLLRRELQELEDRLPRPPLTAVDRMQVASPCSADWRKMIGDDRVRMCAECNKNVYDISAMTEAEALSFLAESGGACVRFYRRADGRVMTADCPVGVTDKRRRLRILAVCSIPVVAGSIAMLGPASSTVHHQGQVTGGFGEDPLREHFQGYVMKGTEVPSETPHVETLPDALRLKGEPPDRILLPQPK